MSTLPMQWQLREGTLLLAMFRENYQLLARYSTALFPGGRYFSADLPQVGLEVPCTYDFSPKIPVQSHFFMDRVRSTRPTGVMSKQIMAKPPNFPAIRYIIHVAMLNLISVFLGLPCPRFTNSTTTSLSQSLLPIWLSLPPLCQSQALEKKRGTHRPP